jgi:hypothetical protein
MVFWASYPGDDSLRDRDLKVLSIYGSEDGLTTPGDIAASRPLLPPDALFDQIEGGNHSQFGSYGFQSGDLPALISPEDQWDQVAEATVNFLADMEEQADD